MVHFAAPWFLLLLILVPPILWFHIRRRRGHGFSFSSIQLTAKSGKLTRPGPWGYASVVLRALTLIAFILALAGPKVSWEPRRRESEGLDIVIAIDTSGSMEALDFEIDGKRQNRLKVVKQVIADFIKKRIDDRIGMVVFGSQAFTQVPLTLDHRILLSFLSYTKIGMAGRATAIGDAIAVATKRLNDVEAKSKVMILLTDGSNTAGEVDPITATHAAAELGIRIYAIAVGSHDKVPFPVEGMLGSTLQYREVELDEALLKEVSRITHGKYFLASNTDMLMKVYETIDRLEKTKKDVEDYSHYQDIYPYFIAAALALLMLELLLKTTRFEPIP